MAILERVPNKAVLARDLGVTYSWLHRILSGKAEPSVPLAKRIQVATGGLIKWWEFFQDVPPLQDDNTLVHVVHKDHPTSKRDRHTMADCGMDHVGSGTDLALKKSARPVLTSQDESLPLPSDPLSARRGDLVCEKSEPEKKSHRNPLRGVA